MVSDWKEVTLSELVDFTPKRTIKKNTVAPFISMADVTENCKFITEVFEKEYTGGGSRFSNGDTLFARITPCLQNGKNSKVSGMASGAIGHGSTEFIVLAAKNPKYDEDFIYYLTRLPAFRAYAESRMIGSTGRQRVSWQDLAEYELFVPTQIDRKNIGSFLSSLDDKIELNRQMNETLEAMAQALFKSWFVDFDPVLDNAIAAGNPIPDELSARAEQRQAMSTSDTDNHAIRALFPDAFEFTEEMGWIPRGWVVGQVSDLCEKVQNGGTPKRDIAEFWDDATIPWLTSGEVRQKIIIETKNNISELGLQKSSAKWLPIGSTIIAMYGATAGQVAFISTELTTNQAVCGLIPKKDFQYFNYLTLEKIVGYLENQARGSAQQNISKGIIEETKVIIPNMANILEIERQCHEIFKKWSGNLVENQTLAKLRDTLLPKLLSGELRITDAAAMVDKV